MKTLEQYQSLVNAVLNQVTREFSPLNTDGCDYCDACNDFHHAVDADFHNEELFTLCEDTHAKCPVCSEAADDIREITTICKTFRSLRFSIEKMTITLDNAPDILTKILKIGNGVFEDFS